MYPWAKYLSDAIRGERSIGLGLLILITFAWWPDAPVVTAIATIALGATDSMIARFRSSPAAIPIMVLHGMTYTLLYALFVGARLHVATPAALTPGVSGLAMLDLIASAFPMAIALKRISSCLWPSALSRP
jgi:hypothetical protein